MNREKFEKVRKLGLPIGEYAIIGSGPLGIRNIRDIADIDMVVSSELQRVLAEKYGVTDNGKEKKIVFPGGEIEAFWEDSFELPLVPIADTIREAEIIEGLPFQSLDQLIHFKQKIGREKDLNDIRLIKEWQERTQDKA